ncbi:hypothetical protein KK062_02910 [Fulvivirgaceae bacterium PWU5]|uniref:Tetratricopeptide repeat protein n=1 Tax=Dawidia cretensis TaxID=2782350 RepID=A0AAP2DTI5_9BACT|nr:hypothetical protein [Dawidia cretensis]MBT1707153.1 hypothetical protein [Dawidia cretensis]
MVGLYTPLLILQAICLYHAYRNRADQYWYWLIVLVPGIGCAFYLAHNFYNRNNLQTLKQGLNEAVNSNYRIEQLEKQVKFVDNVANKTLLADAYVSVGRLPEAIALYNDCLSGAFMADDPILRMKLMEAHYFNKAFDEVLAVGRLLESEKDFRNSQARIAYAWSHHYTGQSDAAAAIFENLNKTFTNYDHRLAYCHFLRETGQREKLQELVRELMTELLQMSPQERKYHRSLAGNIRGFAKNQNEAPAK